MECEGVVSAGASCSTKASRAKSTETPEWDMAWNAMSHANQKTHDERLSNLMKLDVGYHDDGLHLPEHLQTRDLHA